MAQVETGNTNPFETALGITGTTTEKTPPRGTGDATQKNPFEEITLSSGGDKHAQANRQAIDPNQIPPTFTGTVGTTDDPSPDLNGNSAMNSSDDFDPNWNPFGDDNDTDKNQNNSSSVDQNAAVAANNSHVSNSSANGTHDQSVRVSGGDDQTGPNFESYGVWSSGGDSNAIEHGDKLLSANDKASLERSAKLSKEEAKAQKLGIEVGGKLVKLANDYAAAKVKGFFLMRKSDAVKKLGVQSADSALKHKDSFGQAMRKACQNDMATIKTFLEAVKAKDEKKLASICADGLLSILDLQPTKSPAKAAAK